MSAVQLFSQNAEVFTDVLLMETKGISAPDEDDAPFKSALVMFVSFMIFGAIPVIPFAIMGQYGVQSHAKDLEFILSMIFTAVALFALGAVKVV